MPLKTILYEINQMNKKTLFIGTFSIGILLFIASFKFFNIQEFKTIIAKSDLRYFIGYLMISFVIMCFLTIRWKIITNNYKIPVKLSSLIAYRYVGFAVSFITPGPRVGGEPFRAALLSHGKHKFPTTLSTVIADKTLELLTYGILFAVSLFAALITLSMPQSLRTVLLSALLIILFLVIIAVKELSSGRDPISGLFRFLKLNKLKVSKKYSKEIKEFEKSIKNFYSKDKKAFWSAFIVSAVAWFTSLVEFTFVLRMLGVDPSLFQVFLVFSVVGFAYLLPIPMALGVLEAMQAALFAALGMPPAIGAALAMITRARDILWTIIGYIIYAFIGFDRVKLS